MHKYHGLAVTKLEVMQLGAVDLHGLGWQVVGTLGQLLPRTRQLLEKSAGDEPRHADGQPAPLLSNSFPHLSLAIGMRQARQRVVAKASVRGDGRIPSVSESMSRQRR